MRFEESRLLGPRRPSVGFADAFFISVTASIIFAVFRNYAVSGEIVRDYLMAGDGMGHAYKVEMVTRMLFNDRMLVDWDDGWYGGYHPFHFYSPLGYVPYVVLNIVLNDLGAALRVGLVLGFITAAVGMYFLVLTLLHDRAEQLYVKLAAAGAALFFSLHSFNTIFTVVGGELPALYGIAMMPVSLMLLFKLLRSSSLRMSVGYALVTGIIFLAHSHFGMLAFVGGLLLFVGITVRELLSSVDMTENGLSVSSLRKKHILRTTAAYLLSVVLLAGLVAFWILPFFIEASALANMIAGFRPLSQTSIGFLDIVTREITVPVTRYVGAVVIVAMFFAFLDRKNWSNLGIFFFVFVMVWLLALGSNTPIYSLLPFGELFLPHRAVILLVLITGCVLPYSLLAIQKRIDEALRPKKIHRAVRHGLASAVAVLLILLVMFDMSIGYNKTSDWLSSGNSDFIDLSNLVRSLDGESEGARLAFVGTIGAYSGEHPLFSYSPMLTNRPYADGYYVQGSKLSYATFYSSTVAVERNETKFFLGRFVDYDIKYVVVDLTERLILNNLLQTGQFRLVDRVGRYGLLEFFGKKGFIIEGRPDILVIGVDDYTLRVAKGVLDSFAQNFTVTMGQYTYIDDYTFSDLRGHDGLVIYGIKYHNVLTAECLLLQYVKEGGFLVIDADSSASLQGKFMGAKYYFFEPSTPSSITYSKFNLTSDLKPSEWSGVGYNGLDEPLLVTSENNTIIGMKDGVVFVGGNLFYRTGLTKEPAQISLLEQLVALGLKSNGGQRVDYQVIEKRPDHKEYRIRLASDAMVRFSTTTSPYWKVYVDGVPTKVTDQAGFVRLFVRAGEHTITFRYTDTAVKTASNVVTTVSLALCALVYLKKIRLKRQSLTRIPATPSPLNGPKITQNGLTVSVIIPALNEESFIGDALRSLSCQSHRPFEIFVVDGGSQDRTINIAKEAGARVLTGSFSTKTAALARNAGAAAATGDILVFMDADTRPPPDWLKRIVTRFAGDARLVAASGSNWPQGAPIHLKIEYMFYDLLRYVVSRLPSVRQRFVSNAYNLAVRREAFLRAGGFSDSTLFRNIDGNFGRVLGKMKLGKTRVYLDIRVSGGNLRRYRALGLRGFHWYYLYVLENFVTSLKQWNWWQLMHRKFVSVDDRYFERRKRGDFL